MGDAYVGLQARLMSQALRKITGVLNKSNTVTIFINQLCEKVGIMFCNPEVTPVRKALKFYSTVKLDVRGIETLKQNGEVLGNRTKVKVVKNKITPPFREAELTLFMVKVFQKRVIYWIFLLILILLKNHVYGLVIMVIELFKEEKM